MRLKHINHYIRKAIKQFNYLESLPRVIAPSLAVMLGLKKIGTKGQLVMTCSISEDYARIWLYFARLTLGDKYDFLIVDSAGDFDRQRLKEATVVKFLNYYHGKKVDRLLRYAIKSQQVFLCDDDKYIIKDIGEYFSMVGDDCPAVSLSPRISWRFQIEGASHMPMGSYALLFDRLYFINNGLKLESPVGPKSPYKVFTAGVKTNNDYDTADYANEQLILSGKPPATFPGNDCLLGFDGMSAPRLLVKKYGKKAVTEMLLEADNLWEGASGGAVIKAIYGMVKLEDLYRTLFGEEARFRCGFSDQELKSIVAENKYIANDQKESVYGYFGSLDNILSQLTSYAERAAK